MKTIPLENGDKLVCHRISADNDLREIFIFRLLSNQGRKDILKLSCVVQELSYHECEVKILCKHFAESALNEIISLRPLFDYCSFDTITFQRKIGGRYIKLRLKK